MGEKNPIKWYKDAQGKSIGIYSRMGKGRKGQAVERFTVRFWHPERKRLFYAKAGTTLEQAWRVKILAEHNPEKAIAKREAARAVKAAKATKPLTFEELADRFLADYKGSMKGRRRGLKTEYYNHVAESWKAFFTGTAAGVTRVDVESYRDHLKREEYGESTIRKYVGTVGTLYRWAMKAGLVTVNPAEGVDRPPEPDGLIEILTREEVPRFLDKVEEPYRLACEFYLAGGFRMGEGMDLRWGQVSRESSEILIHESKTNKARSVAINATLAGILDRATAHLRSDILRKDVEAGHAPEAFVLCYPDGLPLDRFKLARAIHEALDRAEILKRKGACANLLRHTFGSRLAEKGVPMPVIATLMGNSPEIAFKHYVRFSPGHLKAAMATLDPVLPKKASKRTVANTVARPNRKPQAVTGEMRQVVTLQ
jgi:site-specific recombinase XerD